jgi:hypothetical protein
MKTHLLKMKLMACIMILLPAFSFGRRIRCKEFDNFGKLCQGDKVRATKTRIVDGEIKFEEGQVGVVKFLEEAIWPGDFKPFIKWNGSASATWVTPRNSDMKKTRGGNDGGSGRSSCYTFDNFGKLCIGNYIKATKTRRFTTGQKAGWEIFVKGQKGVVKKIEERWPGKWVVHVKWDGSQDTKWLTPSAADLAKIGSSGNMVGRNCKTFENFGKLCVGDNVLATSTRTVNGKVKFKKGNVGVVTKIARNSAGTEVPYVEWRGSKTAEWLTPRSTDLVKANVSIGRKNLRRSR